MITGLSRTVSEINGDFGQRQHIFHTPVFNASNFVTAFGFKKTKTRICAAEMTVRYAALSACRKVHVCHCNSLGGAT